MVLTVNIQNYLHWNGAYTNIMEKAYITRTRHCNPERKSIVIIANLNVNLHKMVESEAYF